MFPMSKRWKMVSAVGQGVIFSMALTGAVRIGFALSGREMPENLAGNIFLFTSVVAGSLSAYLYGRYLKAIEPREAAPADARWR